MSYFEDLSAEEKRDLQREFENSGTSRERKIELVTLLQEGADEAGLSNRCPRCQHYPFFAPNDEALIEGHVYSQAGLAEVQITRYCEFCFDLVTVEPDEEEDDDA